VCVTGTIRSYRGVPEIIARESAQIRMEQPETAARQQSDAVALGCDASLWNHVNHPGRLEVKEQCVRVTDTIQLVRPEPDGDNHIRVRLDPPYANVINNENITRQDGDLVVEPVCENPVTQPDVVAACRDFHSDAAVPPVGSHVTVVGSYVLRSSHEGPAQ
jgi:hypothetical protein